jgi:beta-lactamase class D
LAPKIGSQKIQKYLADFNYGTQDISGGITKFWLSSTLTISADEQVNFLKYLWQEKLNVSDDAMKFTKKSIYAETLSNGAILQGKTGSANLNAIGWFIGYLHHKNNDYIFVTNYASKNTDKISAGMQAKNITKNLLEKL